MFAETELVFWPLLNSAQGGTIIIFLVYFGKNLSQIMWTDYQVICVCIYIHIYIYAG